ncbi:MAG: hypothetical protein RL172_2580 [Bacteroidota bacterium]|jgi:hypothetical protein
MKKVLVLATAALLVSGVSFADNGKKCKKACCKKTEKKECCKKSSGKSCGKTVEKEKTAQL